MIFKSKTFKLVREPHFFPRDIGWNFRHSQFPYKYFRKNGYCLIYNSGHKFVPINVKLVGVKNGT